jgi:hypothetical protein
MASLRRAGSNPEPHWARLRKARQDDKQIGKLEFEERPDSIVRTLYIEPIK